MLGENQFETQIYSYPPCHLTSAVSRFCCVRCSSHFYSKFFKLKNNVIFKLTSIYHIVSINFKICLVFLDACLIINENMSGLYGFSREAVRVKVKVNIVEINAIFDTYSLWCRNTKVVWLRNRENLVWIPK